MERIHINNFLSISNATIELRKINVFIGPQAQGKSIIAKLINFFKDIPISLVSSLVEENSKREFSNEQLEIFEKMFNKVYWESTPFKIKYENNYYSVEIENKEQSKKNKLVITFSEEIDKAIRHVRNQVKKNQDTSEKDPVFRGKLKKFEDVREALRGSLFRDSEMPMLEQMMYMPAGRSFFANLQKNIFSFLTTNIKIDYFLTEFGSVYERTRDVGFYKHLTQKTPPNVSRLVDKLICGKYSSEKGLDWITGRNGKINVANSSSGQQESLPMALMLSTWPYVSSEDMCRSFIIEEPEAHLFPSAQATVVSLIANAYNHSRGCASYTITTHSPYILTAINNLIQAGNTISDKGVIISEKVYDLIPKDEVVLFSDVSAYLINGGVAEEILDNDLNLIDAVAIDKISNVFSEKFDKLIDLQYSDDE